MDEPQQQSQVQEPVSNPQAEPQATGPSEPENPDPEQVGAGSEREAQNKEQPTVEPVEESVNSQQLTDNNEPAIESVQIEESIPAKPIEPQTPEHEIQEKVIEKIVEKIVPRELNEEEQQVLYRTRLKTLSVKGNLSRSNRRLVNHAKIIEYLKQHGYITNDEVEKICKVKDRTAFKYLQELETFGTIIQLGKKGKTVRYRLTQGIQPASI